MRMDRLADVGGIAAHVDRQRELADEISRAGADDAAAEDAMVVGVEDELGETLVARVGNRASRGSPRELGYAYLGARLLRFFLGEADPRDLRIGVSHLRDDPSFEVVLLALGSVRGHLSILHCHVRELRILRNGSLRAAMRPDRAPMPIGLYDT